MSILNRRNAITGWAVWKIARRLVKRKAKEVLAPPPPRKPPLKKAFAVVTATALGVATFLRLRRKDQD